MLCTIVPNPNGLAAEVCCTSANGDVSRQSVTNIENYLKDLRKDIVEILLGAPNPFLQSLAKDLSIPVTVHIPTAADITHSYLTSLKLASLKR